MCQQCALTQQLQRYGDYLELLELAVIFIGNVPHRGLKFSALNRYMIYIGCTYAFKILMFRQQFKLTV